jgi:adenylate cyclase
LSQQVSSEVAQHLIDSKEDSLAVETEACIVFIDVRNFTPTVRNKNPQEIIQFQNDLFAFMMDTIIQHKGIVNTFLGDGFMATFGAPVATGQDHIHAFEAIKSIINQLNDKIVSQNIEPVRIGVGVYAGNVIAGNVGSNTRKQYSVNGQPVIMASRLEQLNKEFGSCLIMSKTLFESLPDKDNYTPKYEWVSLKGLENQIEVAIFTENNLINI